jgi:hypothetical protein
VRLLIFVGTGRHAPGDVNAPSVNDLRPYPGHMVMSSSSSSCHAMTLVREARVVDGHHGDESLA